MRANIVEATIGALVLLVAGFFFYYAYSASTGSHRNGYMLSANFDRVDGLNIGSDIKMSGVKIGLVKDIRIDPKSYMATVTLLLDSSVQLPTDTVAEIISESLMGGKYVALVPGGEEKILTSGQQITFTQAAVSWESLIGKFLFSKDDDKKK